MKKLLILLFSIFISFNSYGGLFDKTVCVETDAQLRDGVIYLPNKTKPFSGKNLCKYENGQNKSKGKVEDGKKDDIWTEWEENGQIKFEGTYRVGQVLREKNYQNDKEINDTIFSYNENGLLEREDNYKDGKLEGSSLYQYNQNGQKELVEHYQDGNLVSRTKSTYYENGQIKKEENYKDGKKDGKWTDWFDNGQIQFEINHKDGKWHGSVTSWYKNGEKAMWSDWKEGVCIDGYC